MIGEIYTDGYGRPRATGRIDTLMRGNSKMLLVDTRMSPGSRMDEWRQPTLQAKYGKRYRWAGKLLGNTNFAGDEPIQLADAERGIQGLLQYLNEGYSLILLCGCRYYERCHRSVIVDLLRATAPWVIIHPEDIHQIDSVKCLSVQQPWSFLLAHGLKDIENRDWSTTYRGPLLIHAGAKIDMEWFHDRSSGKDQAGKLYKDLAEHLAVWGHMPNHKSLYPTGAIVGMAELVDVVTNSNSRWFFGEYGFVLKNARPLEEPVPYKGSLKLFDVPRSVIEAAVSTPV